MSEDFPFKSREPERHRSKPPTEKNDIKPSGLEDKYLYHIKMAQDVEKSLGNLLLNWTHSKVSRQRSIVNILLFVANDEQKSICSHIDWNGSILFGTALHAFTDGIQRNSLGAVITKRSGDNFGRSDSSLLELNTGAAPLAR
ncbi:hypothetical protein TNCV_2787441 [Trichonephila clavipes]|uniref:Uncharacterized protein n=1 Tax=Trichonephila clavipes TaxID=2585209 RepID=A0A8X6SS30_TRICX|nr:hypothetical protein TNCV_2787441 [Trichonephila clavipes]